MRKILFGLMILILIAPFYFAEEIIYPSTISELTTQVTLYGQGNISGLAAGEEAKLQTITFQESEYQKVEIVKEELIINDTIIKPTYVLDEFNNKYAVFNITQNGDFNYEITANIQTSALITPLTKYIIPEAGERVKKYIQPSEKIESAGPEILTLTYNKVLGKSMLETLKQTVNWVNNYVEYATGDDFRKYYLEQKSAAETLVNKKGVCDEFANLAAAILRAKKVPTRIAIGITYDGKDWGNHAWVETYYEPLNIWIPSDPTFGETGFVDAMHIKLGAFDDITNSNARCIYPANASCSLDTQSKLPNVKISDKEFFNVVQLSSNTSTLKTNIWNDFEIKIKNKTNSILMAPVSIRETYKEILIQERKKEITLAPFEEKTVVFKIMPILELQNNQEATGVLTVNSVSSPFQKEITIIKTDQTQPPGAVIEDITPIAHSNKVLIRIKATNYYQTPEDIKISITSGNDDDKITETIPATNSKVITREMNEGTQPYYDINIDTKTEKYYQRVVTIESKLFTPTQTQTPLTIEMQIQNPTEGQTSTDSILKSPIAIIMGLLAGITIVLLGLFLVNKRYV
ncbi:MAG: transglutaminase domain-containing protein [Candidatus Diapherotrites archaeon]|nr:transglutaminase domain-containing protein [Candidatus Diapherotrites archaeon]